MIDYATILRSGVFRFLIGDDAQPFTVPRGLFKDVSDPLHSMINNEQLKESIEGQAIITDCEGEVFAALCQYCLTGAYDVPHVAISDLEDPEHWEEQGFTAKEAVAEDQQTAMADPQTCRCGGTSFACATCEDNRNGFGYQRRYCRGGQIRCGNCGNYRDDFTGSQQAKVALQRKKPRTSNVSSKDTLQTQRYSKHRPYYDELWNSFKASLSEAFPNESTTIQCDNEKAVEYVEFQPLVFHCKVFVLAEKYLASRLMKLAAENLHNGLLELPQDTGSIHDIMYVLEYCFESTGGSKTSHEGALAIMVVAYAAARAPELKELGQFRALLAANPDMASRFVMALG